MLEDEVKAIRSEITQPNSYINRSVGPQEDTANDLLREFHDRERRRKNFIIFGLPESDTESTAALDETIALDVLNATAPNNNIDPTSVRIFRLGKFVNNKFSPI